jgi:hypothetical protein
MFSMVHPIPIGRVKPRDDISRRAAAADRHGSVLGDARCVRRKGVRSDWADANRPGMPTGCFIEGPSFDADGNLYIVGVLDSSFV